MTRLTVAVTEGILLRLNDEYALAAEALTFLEKKRDLLLGELLRFQSQTAKLRRRVHQALEEAYGYVRAGLLSLGEEGVARAALGLEGDDQLILKERSFLGLPMPIVEFQAGSRRRRFSFADTVVLRINAT